MLTTRLAILLLCLAFVPAVRAQDATATCNDSTVTLERQADACLKAAKKRPRDGAARRRAAEALRSVGRNEEAIEQYRQAIKIDARDAAAHHGLAHVLSNLDRDDEALREYRATLKLTPEDLELRSDILWLLAYLERADTVALEVAELLRVTPDSALALKAAGDAVYEANLYAEAIPFFEKALALDSTTFVHHTDLAYTLARLDRVPEAIAEFERGIVRVSQDTAARAEFARFLYQADQPLAAAAQFDTIARIAAYDPDPLRYKGDVLRELGQHDAAIAAYREAVTRDPTRADSHYDLGHGILSAGQAHSAVAEFLIAVRLDSLEAVYHNDLGVALEEAGRLDTARHAYARAATLDGEAMLFHVNLVMATARAGYPDEARALVQQWIDGDTTDAKRELLRAQLLLELRDADATLASANRVLTMDSTVAEAHMAIAVGHMLKEDAVRAEAALVRGLAQDSTAARLWAIRGLLYTAQEQHERAMEYWSRVQQLQPDLLQDPNLRAAYEMSNQATGGSLTSGGTASPFEPR
jgi:tetratricopeptide (TPR) repeat protein